MLPAELDRHQEDIRARALGGGSHEAKQRRDPPHSDRAETIRPVPEDVRLHQPFVGDTPPTGEEIMRTALIPLFTLSLSLTLACAQSTPAQDTKPAASPPAAAAPAEAEGRRFAGANKVEVSYMGGGDTKAVDDATHIEALIAALGDGELTPAVPKCMPKVRLSFMKDDTALGQVSFCNTTLESGVVRVDIGEAFGALQVEDPEPLKKLLAE